MGFEAYLMSCGKLRAFYWKFRAFKLKLKESKKKKKNTKETLNWTFRRARLRAKQSLSLLRASSCYYNQKRDRDKFVKQKNNQTLIWTNKLRGPSMSLAVHRAHLTPI
jgi:hypothetical protein